MGWVGWRDIGYVIMSCLLEKDLARLMGLYKAVM